jgi:hypothetical protein
MESKQAKQAWIVFPFFSFFPRARKKMLFRNRKYLPPFVKEKLGLRTRPPDTLQIFCQCFTESYCHST